MPPKLSSPLPENPVAVADSPPPELIFKRRLRFGAAVRELWGARELVWTLAEREMRARYKQAVLGFAWAVITPVILMLVFTLVVKRVARVDTGDVPYPLFSYLGLLPWSFFASSVSQGGQSLVSNSSLLNKVYCPREVFPLSSVIVAFVDMVVSTGVLLMLFVGYGYAPRATAVWVPVLLLVQLAFVVGVTFWMSAVLVYLRDLRHALPLLLQMGLFGTPVAWSIGQFVSQSWQPAYAALNPLAAVIDGYRRTVLNGLPPRWDLVGPAAATSFVTLVVGYVVLKKLETRFADVA